MGCVPNYFQFMNRSVVIIFFMVFTLFSSCVQGNNIESQKLCDTETLKQNVRAYYDAVNAENKETMYFYESEQYKKMHSLSNYNPQLLEMKRDGRFDKLEVKSVELKNANIATIVVNFLVDNKIEKVWYIDGSFLQSWKCKTDTWAVDTPPTIILLK